MLLVSIHFLFDSMDIVLSLIYRKNIDIAAAAATTTTTTITTSIVAMI